MTELMEEIHNNIPKVFVNYMLLFNVSQVCICVINRCLYHSTNKNTSLLMFNVIKVCVSYKALIINTLGLRKKIHSSWRKTECGPD